MNYVEQTSLDAIPHGLDIADRLTAPFFTVDFDFVLAEE